MSHDERSDVFIFNSSFILGVSGSFESIVKGMVLKITLATLITDGTI